ncbi:MAG: aromatic amino acid transport family protein [Candidatus Woesearchaeota archaeon]
MMLNGGKKSVQKLYLYEAVATLVGTIIGAGVLGIPYVMAKAGFLTGLLVLLLLGMVILTVNLCIGEVVLRTKGIHQLTGYVGIYLGDRGRRLMTLAMIIGNLLIYVGGLIWLTVFTSSFRTSVALGLISFLPGDLIKIVLASLLLPSVWNALHAWNVLP